MQKKFSFESLSGSKEFKEVLSGKKLNSHLFTIFYKLKNFNDKKNSIQLSCVAAKKLGNAVKRNLAKRRIKALKDIFYINGKKELDYILVIKKKLLDVKFESLSLELEKALYTIKKNTL